MASMYNKLFTKILDSSIWLAPDPHRLVWITLLAAMDEDSNAMFASVLNLAARARVSVEDVQGAITAFESPDPYSGDPENEGRRIERIPGGWHILNGQKYRTLVTKAVARERTRERVAKYRAKVASNAGVTACNAEPAKSNAAVTPSEAEAETRSEARAYVGVRATETRGRESSPDEWDSHRAWAYDELRSVYPSNLHTDADWHSVSRVIAGRIHGGEVSRETLHQLTLAFAAQVDANGNRNTKFVENPLKHFDGRGKWKGPFALPASPEKSREESPMDRIRRLNAKTDDARVIEHG